MELVKNRKNVTDKEIVNINIYNKEIDKVEKSSKKWFTWKQKVSLCLLAATDFMSFCSMSIMAPFFPREAELKGMSETTAGFVFSFYALIMFLFCPIFGQLLPKLGVKFVFTAGIVTAGLLNIVFGCLEYVDDNDTFAILSFVIRGLEALGASAYATAANVIVFNIFPQHAGTVRGILETFVGLGLSVGPAVGGMLFSVGGFGLPFYVAGISTLILGPLNICLLQSECIVDKSCGSLRSILKLPSTIVTCCIIVVVSISWGFLDPTLEPAIRKFNLTPGNVGLIFFLLSATYGMSCPACGWFADRLNSYWILMSGGLLATSISLLLLGPSSFLPFLKDSIWLKIIALSAMGVSVGVGLMPTFQGLLDSAIEGGLSDNLGTTSIVAGLWSSSYSLGEVLGPALGGILLEHGGFPVATTVISFLNALTAIGVAIYFCTRRKSSIICGAPPETRNNNNNIKQDDKFTIYDCEGMTNGNYLNGVITSRF